MTNSLRTHSFSKGPAVAVHIRMTSEGTVRTYLLKSEEFSVSFFTQLDTALEEELIQWLLAYSNSEKLPTLHLPRQNLPVFTEKVLDALSAIPYGETLSYGEVAEKAGSPRASRAVGTICRLNTFPLFIPCHRVLPSTGEIGKFGFGPALKETLLKFEGVI